VLSAHALSVARGGSPVLRGVGCHVAPGEFVAVVGPNGAGKSTLLHALAGDLMPSRGQIMLDDVPLRRWDARDLARRRAVLPQHSPLDFELTVAEVVALGRAPHVTRTRRERGHTPIIHEALETVGMSWAVDRAYPSLSGGERQRVHLARVLAQLADGDAESGEPVRGTRVALLDEPIAALDPLHQHAMLATARRLADERAVAVLAVLHDLSLAACYAHRVLVLRGGEVLADDTPSRSLCDAVVEEAFGLPLRRVLAAGTPVFVLTRGP
jgi:iron complex transport system ATP-binding protein